MTKVRTWSLYGKYRKAEQKTPLSFCTFKYYPHICSANNSWLSCFFNPDRTDGYLSKYEFGLFLCPSVCSRHECRRQIHIRTRRHCVEVCLSYGIRLSFPNIYSNASAGLNQLLLATGLVAVLFSAIANNSCSYMKKSKVTLSVSGERKSYSVEYDSLESLSQSVFDLLGCVSARLDETVVILGQSENPVGMLC